MKRIVLPELLDVLPPQEPAAKRSRRDLRRLNAWMNHPRILARVLRKNLPENGPVHLAELGAGDGHFLLTVARRMQRPPVEAVLVDRLKALDADTMTRFATLGWTAREETAEAAAWLRSAPPGQWTIISNLFFHQFKTDELAAMLRPAAQCSDLVVALEPRRSWLPRLCGRLLWVIGCSRVTRHDARISVAAGFRDGELSALWPDKLNWQISEHRAGLFSHLFIARRKT